MERSVSWDWLKRGVCAGNIRVNESGALVHGVPEGMLLVSPGIFREFARQCRDEIASLRPGVAASEADAGKNGSCGGFCGQAGTCRRTWRQHGDLPGDAWRARPRLFPVWSLRILSVSSSLRRASTRRWFDAPASQSVA